MTAETKATDTDKPKVVRITVPATDEVTMDFLEAQGPRGVTTAVRLLIHSFVAEHGNVDVLSAVSGSLVGTRPITPAVPQGQDVEQAPSEVSDTNVRSDAEVTGQLQVTDTPEHPDLVEHQSEPVTDNTPEIEAASQNTGVTNAGTDTRTDTGVPDGGSPISDMEDLFRQAGKK